MSNKVQYPVDESFLTQAAYAADLAKTLGTIAKGAQQQQTQTSIENAIQTLLAPLQPEATQQAKSAESTDDIRDTNVYIYFAGDIATGKSSLAYRVQAALAEQGFTVSHNQDRDRDVLTVVNPVSVLAGETGGDVPDPRLDPNWCEECQTVHTPPTKGEDDELAGLLTLLTLFGRRKPKA